MTALDQLIAERECLRLMSLYCRFVDTYDHKALLDLWTPDALWVSVKDEMRGHEAIQAYLDRKPRGLSHHLCGNARIELDDDDSAHGVCDFVVHVGEDDPDAPGKKRFRARPLIGRYHDVYRRLEGRWLFAARRAELFPTTT